MSVPCGIYLNSYCPESVPTLTLMFNLPLCKYVHAKHSGHSASGFICGAIDDVFCGEAHLSGSHQTTSELAAITVPRRYVSLVRQTSTESWIKFTAK